MILDISINDLSSKYKYNSPINILIEASNGASDYGNKITIHQGPAIKSLEHLKTTSFDMAFIDADKSNYLEYYKRCLTLIHKGGAIVLDNMLWSGSVIDPQDTDSKALRETGDFIQEDKRVFNILLSIRDGLMLCIKK